VGKFVTCSFCGKRGVRSDEHVWAQWMHDTPGAIELLRETHGERIQRDYLKPGRGADGRYLHEPAQLGPMAKWLPNVKVTICEACNGGWMSNLEKQVQAVLGPFILKDQQPLRLSSDDVKTIATWATKSWMAYALLRPHHQNPFTEQEYQSMASGPQPLARSQIWLLHAREPGSHVAMGIDSSIMSFRSAPPDLATAQDNWAYAYLAVAGVVLVMQLLPPEARDDMADLLAPPMLAHTSARRVWPDLRPQFFPLGVVPDEVVLSLRRYPQEVFRIVGLPTVGLTGYDSAEVVRQFMAGADPTELRRQWNSPE